MLDGHNEYGRCFGDRANVVNSSNLKLPFWLFNFEEFVDVIYSGRPAVEDEIEILAELIPIAKGMYLQHKASPIGLSCGRPTPKTPATRSIRPCPICCRI